MPDHKIIGEPNQKRPPLQAGFYLVLKPLIKDGVQVDVAQHRAYATSLRCSFIGITHASRFPDACFQPLANKASYNSVTYPPVKYLPQVLMIQRIKEFAYIYVEYPAPAHLTNVLSDILQCLMCRPTESEPVGTVHKVLFVDRFQNHCHTPLQNFVLKRWYADWTDFFLARYAIRSCLVYISMKCC